MKNNPIKKIAELKFDELNKIIKFDSAFKLEDI